MTEVDLILGTYHTGHASRAGEKPLIGDLWVKPTMLGHVVFVHRHKTAPVLAIDVTHIAETISDLADFTDFYRLTITRSADGRYKVQLPAITVPIRSSNNKKLAIKRYCQLIERAKKEQRFSQLQEYFTDLIKKGIIELVNDEHDSEQRVYLPYHYIIKESSLTAKVRAVFDGSASNDCLFKGIFSWDLVATIIAFRLRSIGVMADLAQAFLQLEIAD